MRVVQKVYQIECRYKPHYVLCYVVLCVCLQLTYGNVSPANLLQCARQPVVVYLPAMSLQPVLERRATGGLLV